jgi:DNA-binding beta-propeller fold protein YncE
VDDTFEQHKIEIVTSLEPIEKQVGIVNKALEELDQQSAEVDDQRGTTKSEIARLFRQINDVLEARKADLVSQVDQLANQKLKNLAAQKDEVETVQTQLASCLSFVRESLRTGSQGEVMKMKKTVMKQIKEMTGNFKPDKLAPCEEASFNFKPSLEVSQACQQFGEVYVRIVSQEKCYASGKGLELAKVGKPATVVLHIVDEKGEAYSVPMEIITCEFVSVANDKKTKCSIKAKHAGQYEIIYQPTGRGRHQLHIKVEGKHIKGSPFPILVKLPLHQLGTPVKIISGVKDPWGVAVNKKGEIIVAESTGHCITIFSPTGKKLQSFGSRGSGQGQFSEPRGVAVDDDNNILVADNGNNRIQKFTPNGDYLSSVSLRDNNLNSAFGIKVHANKKIFVANYNTHSFAILNPDLTLYRKIGEYGSKNVHFHDIHDIALDRAGNVFVAERECNNGIQVLTAEGQYLRKFGSQGSGPGQFNFPSAIAVDSEDMVYVTEQRNHRVSIFKTDGTFVTTFGSWGKGQGQFSGPNGIAVDKDGFIYVADHNNGRIQIL